MAKRYGRSYDLLQATEEEKGIAPETRSTLLDGSLILYAIAKEQLAGKRKTRSFAGRREKKKGREAS